MAALLTPTAEAYSEFQIAFDHYNSELFKKELGERLKPCLITVQRQANTYGYFNYRRWERRQETGVTTDEIALNPEYFGTVPLVEILQTLVHEMCHAWQYHHGTPSRRLYHNQEWAAKMEAIGLMPSDTGRPGGRKTGDKMADYLIPGGPFHRATKALFEAGFQISWLDRKKVFPKAPLHSATLVDELAGDSALDLPVEHLQAPSEAAPDPSPAKPLAVSKVKYGCQVCATKVWGKPGLKVACAHHEPPALMQQCG